MKINNYTRKPKVYHEEEFNEIYMGSTMKIVMRNCLASGNFPALNIEQEKLLGIALANAHSRGEFYSYRCELNKLASMVGYDKSSTNKLAESVLDGNTKSLESSGISPLVSSYVTIIEKGRSVECISLFKKILIEKENGKLYINFRLNEDLKPYVLNQTENFCVLALDLFTKSASPYSIRLGRVLSARVMCGEEKTVTFNKDELAEVLKLPDFYKNNYYETKRIILERAVREVNSFEEGVCILGFIRLAKGRKYAGVSFDVKRM